MNLEAIFHRTGDNWCYMYDRDTVHIRIRTKRGDMERVDVYAGDKYDFEQTLQRIPMTVFASDALFDYWQAEVTTPHRRLQYYFGFTSGGRTIYMTEAGFMNEPPSGVTGVFEYPFLHESDMLDPPEWVKHAVFYQIFPERFANGDPSNDPENVEPWGGTPQPHNFFGGDLQGVIDHLDYLEELGVNAVYFTPIFEATTNHKYDTSDYKRVDPHFGDTETLQTLVKEAHKRGIRVLLDAVFNHSGGQFPPFLDVLEKGEQSPYKDWFHILDDPPRVVDGRPTYRAFAFEPHMPKLNTQHPEVKTYLLDVAKYWIEEVGIDGWRLDVANEVDHQFWREFRQTVKTVRPDAYILGEIWHDSMRWLRGDQFDAVMNYPFTYAVLDYFAHRTINAEQFSHRIYAQLAAYPQQVHEAAFNLLDSHDTPRLLTLMNGNKRRMKLAVLFQLTFLGTPCIYYGDEIGLDGGADPDCRKCMVWDREKQDRELFDFYRAAIRLRKSSAALRTGSFRFLKADAASDVILYERSDGEDQFIIALNNSEQAAEVTLPAPLSELTPVLTSASGTAEHAAVQTSEEHAAEQTSEQTSAEGTVQLEPYGYIIWKRQ
ncbi:neopullulanase [Insulibacter thermoxylanivorax]|uniref:Neopullulanase n=1 Tax=Insulibacter thermoxylanivorax TaxID=2749268 RepID=A0A916VH08_9BACL|nr:alpha-glycosidase [Insulibacter thermoxylanivorax]GFR39563.1 neopullulanase [Insulibacter thermoxylanivorax]